MVPGRRRVLAILAGVAALCVSCAENILVHGYYATTVAAFEPQAQWGRAGKAHLTGIMDWDLKKYMWDQVSGFTTGSVFLGLGPSVYTVHPRYKGHCADCPQNMLTEQVVLRIYVQDAQGALQPYIETPHVPLASLLSPPAEPTYALYTDGQTVLQNALTGRWSRVRLVCDIEFQSLGQNDLGIGFMAIELVMPWEAHIQQ